MNKRDAVNAGVMLAVAGAMLAAVAASVRHDDAASVERERCYAVWTPTAHPIYEHERVVEWAGELREASGSPSQDELRELGVHLGELMYQSHASYSACELGSDGTDLLVELAREAGPEAGIYGAKITGGGSGGTVALLADSAAAPRVARPPPRPLSAARCWT